MYDIGAWMVIARGSNYHARPVERFWRAWIAYERALRRLVRAGDVVLDVGTGTGILAMLAARRGARVHAVESMDVAHVAARLFAHNRLAISLHHADIRSLPVAEPVDLIVSDFLGCFLVDDWMLPAIEAAGRWLKPGGRFCPSQVRLFVAPVGDFALPSVDIWREPFYGIDMAPAEADARRVCTLGNLHPHNIAAAPALYHTFVPPGPPGPFDRACEFTVTRAGPVCALAGWFEAQLADDVVLTTAPGHETHWGQYLFPLPTRTVAVGATLSIRLALDGTGTDARWRWSGAIDGESFDITEALS